MNQHQRFSAGTLLAGMMFSNQQVEAQIFRIAEMNTRQVQALNPQKTVVLIPGGILEEHGPYLPSYTDGYAINAYTQEFTLAPMKCPTADIVAQVLDLRWPSMLGHYGFYIFARSRYTTAICRK